MLAAAHLRVEYYSSWSIKTASKSASAPGILQMIDLRDCRSLKRELQMGRRTRTTRAAQGALRQYESRHANHLAVGHSNKQQVKHASTRSDQNDQGVAGLLNAIMAPSDLKMWLLCLVNCAFLLNLTVGFSLICCILLVVCVSVFVIPHSTCKDWMTLIATCRALVWKANRLLS